MIKRTAEQILAIIKQRAMGISPPVAQVVTPLDQMGLETAMPMHSIDPLVSKPAWTSTIHEEDAAVVVRLVQPNMETGPWIAGGAVLAWYEGRSVGESDIDVWFRDKEQFEKVQSQFQFMNKAAETENAITYNVDVTSKNGRTKIQLIRNRFYESAQAVIDSFDISVCQLATDGNCFILGPMTAKDVREKNLRFVGRLKPEMLKRYVKYTAYGYRDVENQIEVMLGMDELITEFAYEAEDYNNAF